MESDELYALRRSIDYDTVEFSIEDILDKCGKGEVTYNYRTVSWNEEGETSYIESLLAGFPMLPLLFSSNTSLGTYSFINKDTNNKLTALVTFKCDLLPAYGKLYKEFSPYWQRKFLHSSLRTIVLSPNTSAEVLHKLRSAKR